MAGAIQDSAGWRALLYCLLKLPLTAVVVYISVIELCVGLLALTYPAWWFTWPDGLGVGANSWAQTWILTLQGVAVLLIFPWFVRLVVRIDRALAYALLAPNSDRERVAVLEASRSALAADATAVLRRVERDLHDGTQARLVSVGLLLSRLEQRLSDPELREFVDTARRQVSDGLDELRDIIRGIHPPALDHGLATALATLASRSPIRTEFSAGSPLHTSDAEASTLYFSAAELLTNTARHAHASHAELHLSEFDGQIVLRAYDNGRGGARADTDGTGLAGLRRRAEALDGSLSIVSPDGGPITITMTLPRG